MAFAPRPLITFLTALKSGQVAAAPAEGAYGYVADPFNISALSTIIDLKQRDPGKGLICLIGRHAELDLLCGPRTPAMADAIQRYWFDETYDGPPVTLILPAKQGLPELLTGGRGTIAVRCPRLDYMREYLDACSVIGPGPLVSTSLNKSGDLPAVHPAQIPAGLTALTLPQPLSGNVSRIFDPASGLWLR